MEPDFKSRTPPKGVFCKSYKLVENILANFNRTLLIIYALLEGGISVITDSNFNSAAKIYWKAILVIYG
jgi:hypothetical protein